MTKPIDVCICSLAVLQGVGNRPTGVSEDHDVYSASDAKTPHGLSTEVWHLVSESKHLGAFLRHCSTAIETSLNSAPSEGENVNG